MRVTEKHLCDRKNRSAGSKMAEPVTNLSTLVLQDNPVLSFLSSMDTVFKYNAKEVQLCLEKLDLETLRTLHDELCKQFTSCFPQYSGRRPTHRQAKRTILPDIYNLGYSIVCKNPTREADRIFGRDTNTASLNDEENTDKTSEMEHLLKILTDLTSRVQVLEKEMKVVRHENAELKEQLHNNSQSVSSVSPAQTVISVPGSVLPLTQPDPNMSDDSGTSSESDSQTAVKKAMMNNQPSVSDTTFSEGESLDGSPFVLPNRYAKKIRKLNKKVKKLTIAKSPVKESHVKKSPVKKPPVKKSPVKNSLLSSVSNQSQIKQLRASQSNELKGNISDNSHVYIGGVSRDNNESDVIDFLKNKGVANVSNISRLSESSFKCSVPSSDFDNVLHNIDWPNGIRVRAFHEKRVRNRRQYRPQNNNRAEIESDYKQSTEYSYNRSNDRNSIDYFHGYYNPVGLWKTAEHYPSQYRNGWSLEHLQRGW